MPPPQAYIRFVPPYRVHKTSVIRHAFGQDGPPAQTFHQLVKSYDKGSKLLWDHLTPEQRQELSTDARISVEAGGFTYVLYAHAVTYRSHNDARQPWLYLCVNAMYGALAPDWMLTRLLILATDEDYFRTTANVMDKTDRLPDNRAWTLMTEEAYRTQTLPEAKSHFMVPKGRQDGDLVLVGW